MIQSRTKDRKDPVTINLRGRRSPNWMISGMPTVNLTGRICPTWTISGMSTVNPMVNDMVEEVEKGDVVG